MCRDIHYFDLCLHVTSHCRMPATTNRWRSRAHALEYLACADAIPHRAEGEAALLEFLPTTVRRILDLGSGDGRLLALARSARPTAHGVAVDFSDVMLERLRLRFRRQQVTIVRHDLNDALPTTLGTFDVIVSSFAIHHLSDRRKRNLYGEVYSQLRAGGVFCNLEHVASPTRRLHLEFLAELHVKPEQEDPSNKLCDVDTQVRWLTADWIRGR